MADEIKASIGLGNLKRALKVTAAAHNKATLIPILQGVRIEQRKNGLSFEATDLDLFIRVVLPEMAGPALPIILPADRFAAWAKLLDGDDLTINATTARATIKSGRAKAILPVLPASNWPATSIYDLKTNGLTLTQGALARALTFAQIAVSAEESRYTLEAIELFGDGFVLNVVATDGHRLLCYTVESDETINLLLPARLVKGLLPLLTDEDGGVDLAFSDKQVLASLDADSKIYVGAPRPTGSFPAWQSIMPTDPRTRLTVKVADLALSLDRCALLSDENSRFVDLTFAGGELLLHAADAQNGEADETVSIEGALSHEFKTRICADFLKDLLRKLTGELTIALPEQSTQPLLFTALPHEGETVTYLVMPMRLD